MPTFAPAVFASKGWGRGPAREITDENNRLDLVALPALLTNSVYTFRRQLPSAPRSLCLPLCLAKKYSQVVAYSLEVTQDYPEVFWPPAIFRQEIGRLHRNPRLFCEKAALPSQRSLQIILFDNHRNISTKRVIDLSATYADIRNPCPGVLYDCKRL